MTGVRQLKRVRGRPSNTCIRKTTTCRIRPCCYVTIYYCQRLFYWRAFFYCAKKKIAERAKRLFQRFTIENITLYTRYCIFRVITRRLFKIFFGAHSLSVLVISNMLKWIFHCSLTFDFNTLLSEVFIFLVIFRFTKNLVKKNNGDKSRVIRFMLGNLSTSHVRTVRA